jgi:hypothetical protein
VRNGSSPRTYLVECYWPTVTEQQHAAAATRARTAAGEARSRGEEVEFLGSILIPVEETVFCLFTGSEDDVRTTSTHAELPFERILESIPSHLALSLAENGLNERQAGPAEPLQGFSANREIPSATQGSSHA